MKQIRLARKESMFFLGFMDAYKIDGQLFLRTSSRRTKETPIAGATPRVRLASTGPCFGRWPASARGVSLVLVAPRGSDPDAGRVGGESVMRVAMHHDRSSKDRFCPGPPSRYSTVQECHMPRETNHVINRSFWLGLLVCREARSNTLANVDPLRTSFTFSKSIAGCSRSHISIACIQGVVNGSHRPGSRVPEP